MKRTIHILIITLFCLAVQTRLQGQTVVGTIPGQVNVNANGAATYNIPIDVPAGINGLKPNISLVYNSQGGNGPLGIGWSLGGLSSITKTTKTIFSDNAITGVDVKSNSFQLDGNRLYIKNSVSNAISVSFDGNKQSPDYDDMVTATVMSQYSGLLYSTAYNTYETQVKDYNQINTLGLIPYMSLDKQLGSGLQYWSAKSFVPRYFKIIRKNGLTVEYSPKNDVYVIRDENNGNYEWPISKITDTNGNFMTFTYLSSEGQEVIKEIQYTGNGATSPACSIVFNYETKTTVRKTNYGNVLNEDKYVLRSIKVISNGTTLKQYDLNYAIRKEKYYLQEVALTGQSSQKLNSTLFAWGADNDVINVSTSVTPMTSSDGVLMETDSPIAHVNRSDRYWLAADVDGDGKDEVINIYPGKTATSNSNMYITQNYIDVYKSTVTNGQISLSNGIYYNMGSGLSSYANIKSSNPSVLIGDINGDGKKEIIFPQLNGTNKVRFQVAGGATYDRALRYSTQLPVCAVADINNDGIDEIIYLEKGKTDATSEYVYGEVCYTNSSNVKTWVSISVHLGSGLTTLPISIIPADINNDGLKDLIVTSPYDYAYCQNAGTGSATADYNPVDFLDKGSFTAFNGTYKSIKIGDFDGDGVVDFLTNAQGSKYWDVTLSNGNAFTYAYENGGDTYYSVKNEDCIVTDFNHDGKSDLILVNRFYTSANVFVKTTVSWYASTGSGFTLAKSATSIDEAYSYSKYNCIGDFDGDGREDVLSYGSDIYNGGFRSDKVFIQQAFNTNFEANRIKTITDGLGKITQLAYQPLTYTTANSRTFYSKGSGSVYPVADMQMPLYCVSKISEPNGLSGLKTTEFAYSEARAQLTGRGFLGFKTQTISNATTNRKIVSTTDMNLTYYLPDKETTDVSTPGGAAVSKTEKFYTNSKTGSIFLSQPTQTVESDYLNDLTKTTGYVSYDAYGNATSVKTTQGDLVSTQTSTYVQKGSWCPNKPETVTVTRQQNGDTYTRSKSYTYDDKGNLTKEITDPGDANQLTVEYKDWNAFGLPTKTQTTANGILRTTSVSFTPSGRFVQSKTDVLGQTVSYNWDETRGLLASETSRLGTTAYTYNGLGQLTNTAYPDGTHKSQTTQWATAGNAFGAAFYVYQEASGAASTYTWFDGLQREMVRETYGLNGRISRVFTQYRTDGKTDRVSAPTFDSQASAWDAVYDYYPEGRQKTVATPQGTTTTTYSGKTTTVTSPEGTQATTLNAAGQTATSTVNGKTVTYFYYASGKAKTATPDGSSAVAMEYDLQGNRTKLTDPDAGVSSAGYNGYGELKWEKQTNNAAQGEITTTYNYNAPTGQIESRVRNGETTSYGYDTYRRLGTVEISGQDKQTYTYGDYDRVTKLTELIGGTRSFDKQVGYDSYGRVSQVTYPSGYYTVNNYDNYGNLSEVTDRSGRSVWKATEANARGQITRVSKGVRETVYGYDDTKGQLTSMAATGVASYSYSYDAKNNLEYRSDNLLGQKDHFSYDTQNRLTNWDIMNSANTVLKPNSLTYDANTGNIATKSDLGNFQMNYGEGNGKPHALTTVMGKPGVISASDLNVTYTDFRKIKTLTEADKNYTLTYGVDDQRRMSVYTGGANSNSPNLTRFYLGDYEEETDQLGNVKKIHYLSGGSQLVTLNGVETLYYGYTDNQGSLIALTDASGNVVEKYAYDPWGARRNPNDWTQLPSPQGEGSGVRYLTNRGYTGHEHMDMFNIINMNGRVYDPLTAQFFSPDPFIQSGSDWKNYNRYSYCMNNPTRYTDPTGYQYYYMNTSIVDNTRGSGWGDVLDGGGGGGSFLETSLAWNAKGSISYDWGSGKYEYANGDEAGRNAAEDQLYRGTAKENIQYYSGSSLGYDHLYALDIGGSLRLAGSVGGSITGIGSDGFITSNANTYAAVLAANSGVVAHGKRIQSDPNSHYGSDGSYNLYTQNETKAATDFMLGIGLSLLGGEAVGPYIGKVGSFISNGGIKAVVQTVQYQAYKAIGYLEAGTIGAGIASFIGGGIEGAIKYKYETPPDPDMPYLINNSAWELGSNVSNNFLYFYNYNK